MEPKTGRKMVSKGAYITALSQKAAFGVGTLCLFVLTTLFHLITVVCFFAGIMALQGYWYLWQGALGVTTVTPLAAVKCLIVAFVSFAAGIRIKWATEAGWKKTAQKIEVLPLTRANTADLPAPDSLVRASSEPLQAQQAVLLRAAGEGMETPQEQLVRASAGQD